jgi:uncharacterized protein
VLRGDGSLEAWVTSRAVEGAANRALETMLATRLGVPRSSIALVRGARSRYKLVELPLDLAAIRRALSGD